MTTAVQPFAAGTYAADPIHSSFGDVSATLTAGENGEVAITGAAKAESINVTAPEQFRGHLLSPEFFDAESHPEITFASTSVEFAADGTATVNGTLTVKGNSVDIVATGTYTEPTEGMMGETRGAVELTATVDKNALGLTWNAPLPKGGVVLADEVKINVHIEFVAE